MSMEMDMIERKTDIRKRLGMSLVPEREPKEPIPRTGPTCVFGSGLVLWVFLGWNWNFLPFGDFDAVGVRLPLKTIISHNHQ